MELLRQVLGQRPDLRLLTAQDGRAGLQMAFEHRPDVIVPEVGNETIRVVTHLIGLKRGTPVLFLFYTIFPSPLRLYVDTTNTHAQSTYAALRMNGDHYRVFEDMFSEPHGSK